MAITRRISALVFLTLSTIAVRAIGQAPLNPCDLTKGADLSVVTGKDKIKIAVPTKANAIGMVTCTSEWGSGASRSTLDIAVAETQRLWPGIGPGTLRMMVGPAKAGTSGDIAGVGDASLWQTMSETEVKTITLVNGKSLIMTLEGRDAVKNKDGLIALTKLAASKLQK